jgi:hypothetical protein
LALGYDLGCMDNTGDKRADAYALLEWLRLQRELVAEDATLRKWSPAAIEIAVPFLEDLLAQAGEAAKAAKDAEEQEPFNADEPIVNAANQAEIAIAIAASPLFGEQEKGETADPDPKILSLADRIEANKAKTRSRAR